MRHVNPLVLIAILGLLGLAPAATAAPPFQRATTAITATAASSNPRELAAQGGVALFAADGENPGELWRSDGTGDGTYPFAGFCAGGCPGGTFYLAETPIGTFYSLANGTGELWLSRGRDAETVRVATGFYSLPDPPPVWVAPLGKLFFAASSPLHGAELWVSDGTAAGTHLLDVRPGAGFPDPRCFTSYAGRAFFSADYDGQGAALWSSDGTLAGTVRVKRFPRSPGRLQGLMVAGERLVFLAPAAGFGLELWSSDGTPQGTALLADLVPGPASPRGVTLQSIGARAYLSVRSRLGDRVWVTDGTARGTLPLTRPAGRPPASPALRKIPAENPLFLADGSGSRVLFSFASPGHGLEPWITDGTPRGTHRLAEICPGRCPESYGAQFLGSVGSRFYFAANDGAHGTELWTSDGSAGGTHLVRDLCPGDCSAFPVAIGTLAGKLVFYTIMATGRTLWTSDGSAAGTVRLTGPEVGLGIRFTELGIEYLEAALAGDRLLFPAEDVEHGLELWSTDGTPAGTGLLLDLLPGDE